MRNFTIFTLLSLLLVLATATFPCDTRAAELAEDGWSNAFHQAFDNEKDPAKRLKALRDEQGRQQAWLDAAVKRANKKMPVTVKKQFAASQSKWEKWYGLERKFLEAISPNGILSEELEHYLLGILVLRTNFMRVQPMDNTDIDTKDRYVPKPIVFAKERDGMPRDPDGMTTDREERTTEDGHVVAPNLVVSMEHEIQDKWLNADFKALRNKLDDAQKIALRDTQRAWLQWHDADMEYLHAVIGDNGVSEWFRWRELRKFTLRTVQIEYLLSKIGILDNSVMAGVQIMPAATGTKGDESSNRVVEVKTAHELIAAIASDTTIKLAPGRYELSGAVKGAVNAKNGTSSSKAYGVQLDITGVRNLTIEGGANFADYEIVTNSIDDDVMSFSECEGIKLVGLTMGHTNYGECSASVLNFYKCTKIEIENCDLYGSGVYGIKTIEVQGLKVTGGIIRDCSDNLVNLYDTRGALFTGASMVNRSSANAAISLAESEGTFVADVVFDRVNFVSEGAQDTSIIFAGNCGEGFTVKNCTTRFVNAKPIPLDLGTNLSPKQIDGLGFNGKLIEYDREPLK